MQNLWSSLLLFKNIKIKICCNIILPVVVMGVKIWSRTLKEELRLSVFENRVLRRIFRPKRDKVTGEWRKLHIEELNNLHSSPNNFRVIKSRKIEWLDHVAYLGGKRYIQVLGGET